MLEEREAFLRAIFDDPDDDTPRLVFADWLEEHGEEIAAKAIRLSIEWYRCESAEQKEMLRTSISELQFLNATELEQVDGISRYPDTEQSVDWFTMEDSVLSDHDDFRRYAVKHPSLYRAVGLKVTGVALGTIQFETIFAAEALRRVTALDLSGHLHHYYEKEAEPPAGAIRPYHVWNPMGTNASRRVPFLTLAGVHELCGHPGAERLTYLDIRNNDLISEAIECLRASPYLKNLRQLWIRDGNPQLLEDIDTLVDHFGSDVVT